MTFNNRRKLHHSSRVKLPSVYKSASLFFVNIFDLDVGVQVDSVKLQISPDTVGSGQVSHHWTSSFHDHL